MAVCTVLLFLISSVAAVPVSVPVEAVPAAAPVLLMANAMAERYRSSSSFSARLSAVPVLICEGDDSMLAGADGIAGVGGG